MEKNKIGEIKMSLKLLYFYSMQVVTDFNTAYTYDDYCQWEGRWELIEGVPYSMASIFTPQHQGVAGSLAVAFHRELRKNKHYKTFPSIDWKVSETTVVNPDVIIVGGIIIEKDFLDFPPLIIAEVLCDETEIKDRGEKMELYRSQSVKYYLIADPHLKKLEVYELIDGKYQTAAINLESFSFGLENEYSVVVGLADIWD